MVKPAVQFQCEVCGTPFERPAKLVDFYARQEITAIRYCTRKCFAAAKSAASKLIRQSITSRHCSQCKTEKLISEFNRKGDGYSYMCSDCMRLYCQRHYSANSGKAKVRAARNRPNYVQPRVEFIRAMKNVPCADCGNRFHVCAMDFDHLDSTLKEKNVSHLRASSWERIKAEIAKCEVVCANCHRIRTFERLHSDVG